MIMGLDNKYTTKTLADPAAGAEIDGVIDNVEEILGIEVTLDADATAVSRSFKLYLYSPDDILLAMWKSATNVTANQTVVMRIAKYDVLPTNSGTEHFRQIGDKIRAFKGCKLKSVTGNLQAGDQISDVKRVVITRTT